MADPASIIDWPASLRIAGRSMPLLERFTRSAGPGWSGQEQILSALGERWTYRIDVPIHDAPSARSLRTILARLRGRYNYLRIAIHDAYGTSRAAVGAWSALDVVPHSDGAFFGDGSGYALSEPATSVLADAAEGERRLVVDAGALGDDGLVAGVFFSVDDWLYMVTGVDPSGADAIISFEPALRDDVIAGSEARFSARGLFRLASDTEGDAFLASGRLGTVGLSLIEATGRGL